MIPDPTARLRFREMTLDDLDAMAALLGDPAVMAYYPAPKSREHAAAWIGWTQQNYGEHGYGLWVIETQRRWVHRGLRADVAAGERDAPA